MLSWDYFIHIQHWEKRYSFSESRVCIAPTQVQISGLCNILQQKGRRVEEKVVCNLSLKGFSSRNLYDVNFLVCAFLLKPNVPKGFAWKMGTIFVSRNLFSFFSCFFQVLNVKFSTDLGTELSTQADISQVVLGGFLRLTDHWSIWIVPGYHKWWLFWGFSIHIHYSFWASMAKYERKLGEQIQELFLINFIS